jgi:dihydrofolate reductase
MRVSIVVAVAKNGVIGRDGGLAWKISDDLKRFRALTMGKPVIMGRKTFQSIGKPLKGRANIVVSRSSALIDGAAVARSFEDALTMGADDAAATGADEICIIGGAEIYRQALKVADRIHLTEVDAAIDGDVHFPAIDPAEWVRRAEGGCEKSLQNEHSCRYFILDRR